MKINYINNKITNFFIKKKFSEVIKLIEENISEKHLTSQYYNILGAAKLLRNIGSDRDQALECFEKGYNKEKNSNEAFNCFINFANLSNNDRRLLKIEKYYKEAINNFGYQSKLIKEVVYTYILLNNSQKIIDLLSTFEEQSKLDKSTLQELCYFNHFQNNWKQKNFFNHSLKINNLLPKYSKKQLIPFSKDINKKIKIAFFSADIRANHSITKFLKTLLVGKERNNFEIIIISNLKKDDYDKTTYEFQSLADKWIEINGMENEYGINLIRKENLDIAIDLMGYTSFNKIEYFKNRISKTQISWLGYCNTTGLKEMDFLITDNNLIFPNEKNLYSEKIIYLKHIWNCYYLEENKSLINLTKYSFKKKNYILFSSFNNFLKVNDNVINCWAEILKKVNNSKLILKSSTHQYKETILKKFEQKGVKDSLIFEKFGSHEEHLNLYKNVDLALDTFPYNGVTTSFEAILCGIPVLTMKGYNFNSRCGESINKNLGLNEMIANNENDYISKAVELASNIEYLNKIKKFISAKGKQSLLFDDVKFRKNFFKTILTLI